MGTYDCAVKNMIQFYSTPPSFWYQKVRIGPHLTPGHTDPADKWNKLIKPNLPFPVEGINVCDFGCNAGGMLYEMLKDKPSLLTGIESDEIFLAQARLCYYYKQKYGDNVGNIEIKHSDAFGHHVYDLIIAANVLYWVGWQSELSLGNIPLNQLNFDEYELQSVIRFLAISTPTLMVVGSSSPTPTRKSLGQSVAMTDIENSLPYLEKSFIVQSTMEIDYAGRNNNIIICKSRYI